jgi:hypothetical protein
MIDAILSYHLNPLTCGVAKFNQQLAERLGVPCLPLGSPCMHPLISIKPQEMLRGVPFFAPEQMNEHHPPFDLLLHGPSDAPYLALAERIFYADTLGCPSTLQGNPTRGRYRVLTFGMAHKRIVPHYQALKLQLDRDYPDYTVELSTAIHEGHPWEAGLRDSIDTLRAIFGTHLRVLGFLGDDALAKELQDVDAVALYFDPAARANNTTLWAAVQSGKTIYTNTDEHSPDLTKPPTWDHLCEVLCAP